MGFRIVTEFNRYDDIADQLSDDSDRLAKETAESTAADIVRNAPRDTGELAGSVEAVKVGPAAYDVNVGAEHGVYQEHGTVHMPAQPFFNPGVEANRPGFDDGVQRLLD